MKMKTNELNLTKTYLGEGHGSEKVDFHCEAVHLHWRQIYRVTNGDSTCEREKESAGARVRKTAFHSEEPHCLFSTVFFFFTYALLTTACSTSVSFLTIPATAAMWSGLVRSRVKGTILPGFKPDEELAIGAAAAAVAPLAPAPARD